MMMGAGGDAGGGPARHVPVLLSEVLDLLQPKQGEIIIDGTFGAGGYTKALLDRGASVIAIDRDPDAIAAGRALEKESGGRLSLVEGLFSHLDAYTGAPVDGVVLDIGVSSMQLDEAGRGFSFRQDGPLDMRMTRAGLSAADVVNRLKAGDLARVFGLLGEERHAGRIARMIERRRAEKPFATTGDLALAIENLVGKNPKDKIHPATRVFQALRIFVNDELRELGQALLAAERILKPGGRLAVVTFHSLEDRMVKRFIADRSQAHARSRHLPAAPIAAPTFQAIGKAVAAGKEEITRNPRARSAKLRGAKRTDQPARAADFSVFGLPELNVKVER
ncbi:MAG: 16S rRNA (cytosine(1402)-N(4))-methyltransferase RsmH [Rhizobiaceae bacterium]